MILRALRGEALDALSRELGVTAAATAQWRDQFLLSGQAGRRSRETDEGDVEIARMKMKIGEITVENERPRVQARRAEAQHPLVVAEVEAMSQTVSVSADHPYGLALTCRALELSHSTVYAQRARAQAPAPVPHQRGPNTAWWDAELTAQIRRVLATSPWYAGAAPGAGRRPLGADPDGPRARAKGPRRNHHHRPPRPDVGRGRDPYARRRGPGDHLLRRGPLHPGGPRHPCGAAGHALRSLEPVRQDASAASGRYTAGAATGLLPRHDNGSQYCSHYVQGELRVLGLEGSPACVREPEGNGVAERFIRSVKEQRLRVERFDPMAELLDDLQAYSFTARAEADAETG